MTVKDKIAKELSKSDDKLEYIENLRQWLHQQSPLKEQPIDRVRWVPVEKVQANDYNPNSVAGKEMQLLYTSILHDGYTQPIVTIYDKEMDSYVIVDGFHRYFTCKKNKDIYSRNNGCLPIVVLNKDINDRMASTVRHNRARGEHSVKGMSAMVYEMLKNGWKDSDICNELGMDVEELHRLKHITGFSKLFENTEYSRAHKRTAQIKLESEHGQLGKAK